MWNILSKLFLFTLFKKLFFKKLLFFILRNDNEMKNTKKQKNLGVKLDQNQIFSFKNFRL